MQTQCCSQPSDDPLSFQEGDFIPEFPVKRRKKVMVDGDWGNFQYWKYPPFFCRPNNHWRCPTMIIALRTAKPAVFRPPKLCKQLTIPKPTISLPTKHFSMSLIGIRLILHQQKRVLITSTPTSIWPATCRRSSSSMQIRIQHCRQSHHHRNQVASGSSRMITRINICNSSRRLMRTRRPRWSVNQRPSQLHRRISKCSNVKEW